MDDKNIEKLIEKKILETKLEIIEKRLHFVFALGAALLAIFGVLIPMWMTSQSTSKIDKAIATMDSRFEKLAGTQLREPKLRCYFEGNPLENSRLIFNKDRSIVEHFIEIRNEGNSPGNQIRVFLHFQDSSKVLKDKILESTHGNISLGNNWYIYGKSDEKDYYGVQQYYFEGIPYLFVLDPNESIFISIPSSILESLKMNNIKVLLKIYYGQPKSLRIPFIIKYEK
jgi:hypothetical protein